MLDALERNVKEDDSFATQTATAKNIKWNIAGFSKKYKK